MRFRSLRSSLLAAGLCLLVLGGCKGQDKSTSEVKSDALQRVAAMKANVELQMAQQQFLAGDLGKSRKTVDKAIAFNPKDVAALILRGRIMIEQGDLETARAALVSAEEIDPKSVDAQYYLGIVHERFGQHAEAHRRYDAAAQLDPANPQYAVAAGEMLAHQGDLPASEAYLREAMGRFTNNAAVRQSLGNLATLRGDHASAVALLGEARSLAPDDPRLLESLARAQISAGRFADAEANLAILMRDPQTAERRDLPMLRAAALLELGRPAEARSLLVRLSTGELGLRDAAVWAQLCSANAALGDHPALLHAAGRLVAVMPARPDGHLFRAAAYRGQDNLPAALESARAAARVAPQDPEPLILEALILDELGRAADALRTIDRAVALAPDNEKARQLQAVVRHGATLTGVQTP